MKEAIRMKEMWHRHSCLCVVDFPCVVDFACVARTLLSAAFDLDFDRCLKKLTHLTTVAERARRGVAQNIESKDFAKKQNSG
jgi:hypothetical protein